MTPYVRIYDLTRASHLSGKTIKALLDRGLITADASLMHGTQEVPLFLVERYNDLVCKLMIYKEQRGMTRKKALEKLRNQEDGPLGTWKMSDPTCSQLHGSGQGQSEQLAD